MTRPQLGNEKWAFTEAKRRSIVLNGPYKIYKHRTHSDEYIIRTAEAYAPDPAQWRHFATFYKGEQTFKS